jgi:hypothetical protein
VLISSTDDTIYIASIWFQRNVTGSVAHIKQHDDDW